MVKLYYQPNKNMVLQYIFIDLYEIFKVNIWWMFTICWNSPLLGIFKMKKWVEFSLTSFGTLKYDCIIKIIEMFNFLPPINNSVTTGFSFLLIIIPAIISSKTISILHFYLYCTPQYFINILHIIWVINKRFRIIKMI